jgi:hypothetical protein
MSEQWYTFDTMKQLICWNTKACAAIRPAFLNLFTLEEPLK